MKNHRENDCLVVGTPTPWKDDGVKVNGKDDIPYIYINLKLISIYEMDKMEWYDDSHILTIYESQLRDDSPIYEMEHKSHV